MVRSSAIYLSTDVVVPRQITVYDRNHPRLLLHQSVLIARCVQSGLPIAVDELVCQVGVTCMLASRERDSLSFTRQAASTITFPTLLNEILSEVSEICLIGISIVTAARPRYLKHKNGMICSWDSRRTRREEIGEDRELWPEHHLKVQSNACVLKQSRLGCSALSCRF